MQGLIAMSSINRSKTRTALITGASAGLGAEFARQLAASVDRLVLVARRTDRLQQLANSLSVECVIMTADLSLPDSVSELVDRLQRDDIEVDYLINNAGIGGPALLHVDDEYCCGALWAIDSPDDGARLWSRRQCGISRRAFS